MESEKSGNTTAPIEPPERSHAGEPRLIPALTLLDAHGEEHRRGERLLFSEYGKSTFGRDAGMFCRMRPGLIEETGPLSSLVLSREQLRLEALRHVILAECIGKREMRVNGERCSSAKLGPGDLLELVGCCSFLMTMVPESMPALDVPYPDFPFGTVDAFGMAGEGVEIWKVRAQLAKLAQLSAPVLILGETGTGKFPAACAIHGLSRRGALEMITHNAASFTDELIAALLFGNRANYPNSGIPETLGLIRSAEGSSLLLDEIGDITKHMQAVMLVVFDPAGMFTVYGEKKPRRANVRFICSTNFDPSEMRGDFAARFKYIIVMPPLASRREDIPLIARQLVLQDAAADGVANRFLHQTKHRTEVSFDPGFLAKLVAADYPANIRGLDRVLKSAVLDSPARSPLRAPRVLPAVAAHGEITEADAQATLDRHDGNVSAAARELGVTRDTLRRIIGKK